MKKPNRPKRSPKLLADKELGFGTARTRTAAVETAYRYALKRWCRDDSQRKRYAEQFTCISTDVSVEFPTPRYRKKGEDWHYPGAHVLYYKHDENEQAHTAVVELRMPRHNG